MRLPTAPENNRQNARDIICMDLLAAINISIKMTTPSTRDTPERK